MAAAPDAEVVLWDDGCHELLGLVPDDPTRPDSPLLAAQGIVRGGREQPARLGSDQPVSRGRREVGEELDVTEAANPLQVVPVAVGWLDTIGTFGRVMSSTPCRHSRRAGTA
jgi:hypothetical protein